MQQPFFPVCRTSPSDDLPVFAIHVISRTEELSAPHGKSRKFRYALLHSSLIFLLPAPYFRLPTVHPFAKIRSRLQSVLLFSQSIPAFLHLSLASSRLIILKVYQRYSPVPRPIPLTGFNAPLTRSPTHGKRSLVLPLQRKAPTGTARKSAILSFLYSPALSFCPPTYVI